MIILFIHLLVSKKVSLCSLEWLGTLHTAQVGFKSWYPSCLRLSNARRIGCCHHKGIFWKYSFLIEGSKSNLWNLCYTIKNACQLLDQLEKNNIAPLLWSALTIFKRVLFCCCDDGVVTKMCHLFGYLLCCTMPNWH